MHGSTRNKNIKKYNRTIIVLKNVKWYNKCEYRVVYSCVMFTIYKFQRKQLCRLNSKSTATENRLFFTAGFNGLRGLEL